MKKHTPTAIRLEEEEKQTVEDLSLLTSLSQGEIMRRAVRLLAIELAKRGGDPGFLMSLPSGKLPGRARKSTGENTEIMGAALAASRAPKSKPSRKSSTSDIHDKVEREIKSRKTQLS